MTPMIDVVFQLLIYFLCTAGFQKPEQVLPTTLPPEGVGATQPLTPAQQELGIIQIRLEQPGGKLAIELNGSPCVDMADLRGRLGLLVEQADLPVVLDISREVEIGHTVHVYDICRSVGFTKINFSAPGQL